MLRGNECNANSKACASENKHANGEMDKKEPFYKSIMICVMFCDDTISLIILHIIYFTACIKGIYMYLRLKLIF